MKTKYILKTQGGIKHWLNRARILGTGNVTIRELSFTSTTRTKCYPYADTAGARSQRKTSNGKRSRNRLHTSYFLGSPAEPSDLDLSCSLFQKSLFKAQPGSGAKMSLK